MQNVYTASRAFARMRADEAEEFGSLPDLAGRLRRLRDDQADYRTRLMSSPPSIEPDADGTAWSPGLAIDGRRLAFREHAFGQFAQAIGVPPSVLVRCPSKLAGEIVAYFSFLGSQEDRFVRTEGGDIRAFLGSGYTPVNHVEVVERFLESDLPWGVNFAGLTPKRMFILAVEPESKFDGPDGSQLSHCTLVGNSETGEGSFFAQDLWYDYICRNRIIWGAKARGGQFRRIHRSGVREGLPELFRWISSGRAETVDAMKALTVKAGRDVWGNDDARVVEYMRNRGFALWQARDAMASARERWPGEQLSRFRMVSGLTAIAQRLPMDDRYELERKAGELLVTV